MTSIKTRRKTLSELLDEIEWLQQLPPHGRERIYADAFETSHTKGHVVARMGDPTQSWICVADGLLKVGAVDAAGRAIMFTGIPRGSWIGEGSLIKRELRRYDMVAMRECRLIHIPATTFRYLLDTSTEFNHVILWHLNERLSQFIAMIEIERLDPVARVARVLAVLFNPVLYPRRSTALPMSQAEIGELVGLSRQSISGALKQLAREGLITIEYGGVVLNNIGALRSYEGRAMR